MISPAKLCGMLKRSLPVAFFLAGSDMRTPPLVPGNSTKSHLKKLTGKPVYSQAALTEEPPQVSGDNVGSPGSG